MTRLECQHATLSTCLGAFARAPNKKPEDREAREDDIKGSILEQATTLTGGTAQVAPEDAFRAEDDEGMEYHRHLWPYLVYLALALLLLDLLLRRVRLFDRSFKARS